MTKEESALLLATAKGVELLLERVASAIPSPNDYGEVQDALTAGSHNTDLRIVVAFLFVSCQWRTWRILLQLLHRAKTRNCGPLIRADGVQARDQSPHGRIRDDAQDEKAKDDH